MPQQTKGKDHLPSAIRYDGLVPIALAPNAIAPNQTNATVQNYFVIPVAMKILYVVLVATAAANGLTAFNFVLGSGAEGALGTPDNTEGGTTPPTVAPNGTVLFSPDPAVSIASAYGSQLFPVPAPAAGLGGFDVIWPQGGVLTFRYASGAAVGGQVQPTLLMKPYDIKAWTPRNQPSGAVIFLPASDIV